MQQVSIYLDISIKGIRSSSGKFGYVIEYITIKGPATYNQITKCENVTAHKAILLALIEALQHIKKPCEIVIFTDSEYLSMAFVQGWINDWQQHNWVNGKGKPVANKEEWQNLLNLLNEHQFTFKMNQPHSYKTWLNREVNKMEDK